jgi:hypothetical protein
VTIGGMHIDGRTHLRQVPGRRDASLVLPAWQ